MSAATELRAAASKLRASTLKASVVWDWALADLLDEIAGHAESNDEHDGFPPESVITGYTPALRIARLINGGGA